MPKNTLRVETEMPTRNQFTKINTTLTFTVDSKELPNLEVLGKSVEAAMATIEEAIKKSYEVVPERVG